MIDACVEVILRDRTVMKRSPFSSASCCRVSGRRRIQTAGRQQRVSALHMQQEETPLTRSVGLTSAVIDFTVRSCRIQHVQYFFEWLSFFIGASGVFYL